jgi:glycosyltransferase involved in cell wall biosynthesis
MNILMVVPYFGGNRGGNPDVVDLSHKLEKRGHNIVVLSTSFGNDEGYQNDQNVKIFRLKPIYYFSGFDYGVSFPLIKLQKLLKEYQIDVVHGVMEFGTQTFSAVVPSRFRKKPYVFTIQGASITSGSPSVDALMTTFDHTVAKFLSVMSKRIIVLSEKLSWRAQQIGASPSKIRVVPTTVRYKDEFDPTRYDSERTRRELGLDGDTVIGYVGRLVRLKGLAYLLRAFEKLLKDSHSIHLLIVGYGPERSSIESAVSKLGLKTTITGWVERRNVPHYVSAMDILVNPSLTEGLPLTVMEAMAMQKPVVATDVGGTSDLISNGLNGFLVPPHDTRSISTAINTLLLDPRLRHTMGIAGRRIIEENFSWDVIVPKVEKVYEEALH